MNNRLSAVFAATFLGLTFAMAAPTNQPAFADDKPAATADTEDVVYMTDGRVLHGKILSETKSLIIFEYVDSAVQSKAKITLAKDEIAHLDRNVAVTAEPAAEKKPAETTSTGKKKTEPVSTYGAARVVAKDAKVPSFYIVPMKGQMGTDVNAETYKKVVDDIREMKPDVVVIQMSCADSEDVLFSLKGKDEAGKAGINEFDEYRKLVSLFRTDLREFHQVCWVEDSVGISSMVAMSWPEIYMKPTARFGGLMAAHLSHFNIPDLDVRGKMVAAIMALVKSHLEFGGYSLVLADAMVQPELSLSATWKGRDVTWSLDTSGEYLVDGNDTRTTEFRSKDAENLCLSKGTVDVMDDLALLLGYREYKVVDGKAEKLCADYVRDWRRAYDECKTLLDDYQQNMGWANGPDGIKYLGKAKANLEKILSYMERYKAVELRMGADYGLTIIELTVEIEKIKETLRAAKNNGGNRSGGGTSGGGGRNGGRGLGGG